MAAGAEKRAKDAAGWAAGDGDGDDRVDAAEALGPGAAEELEEDGLGLVVHGVGCEDGVGLAGAEEVMKDLIANRTGGLFEGFSGGGGAGGDVGGVEVEGDVQGAAELLDEALVGVGFGAADAVVDVDGGEADTEGGLWAGVGGVDGAEEGDGVCATGEGGADALAGVEAGAVEGEGRGWGHVESAVYEVCGAGVSGGAR